MVPLWFITRRLQALFLMLIINSPSGRSLLIYFLYLWSVLLLPQTSHSLPLSHTFLHHLLPSPFSTLFSFSLSHPYFPSLPLLLLLLLSPLSLSPTISLTVQSRQLHSTISSQCWAFSVKCWSCRTFGSRGDLHQTHRGSSFQRRWKVCTCTNPVLSLLDGDT